MSPPQGMGGCSEAVTQADSLQPGLRKEIAVRSEPYRPISHPGFPLSYHNGSTTKTPGQLLP